MKILVTGSHGLIGTALIPKLEALGHEVVRMHRSQNNGGHYWNPETGHISLENCQGIEAVVHLAGENIAKGRWNEKRKEKIIGSRVKGTHLLSQAIAAMEPRPKVFVSASAIGYYGNRDTETLDENSPPGKGFFAELCRKWEEAASPAREAGIRVVLLRFGIILSRYGGALPLMALPFKFYVGGKMGSGRQMISWILLQEAVDVISYTLGKPDISGPVNVVSPNPVSNWAFAHCLAEMLDRPNFFSVPAFVLRLMLGEMADEMLLSSQQVMPRKLLDAGFGFRCPNLEDALNYIYRE